jgi:hypothetical protein
MVFLPPAQLPKQISTTLTSYLQAWVWPIMDTFIGRG